MTVGDSASWSTRRHHSFNHCVNDYVLINESLFWFWFFTSWWRSADSFCLVLDHSIPASSLLRCRSATMLAQLAEAAQRLARGPKSPVSVLTLNPFSLVTTFIIIITWSGPFTSTSPSPGVANLMKHFIWPSWHVVSLWSYTEIESKTEQRQNTDGLWWSVMTQQEIECHCRCKWKQLQL